MTVVENGEAVVTDYDLSDTSVYNSVLAGGDTYSTDVLGGESLYMLELRNLDTTASYTITLTAFAEKENGARIYDYNGALTVAVTNGEVTA